MRHKVDPIVNKEKVHLVETVLKSIIETGFADNCKEELLEFDKDGKLVSRKPGVTSLRFSTEKTSFWLLCHPKTSCWR